MAQPSREGMPWRQHAIDRLSATLKAWVLCRLLLSLLLCAGAGNAAMAANAALSAVSPQAGAIGLYASYLQEQGHRLTPEEAMAAYRQGRFQPAGSGVLNFGIGARPVWVHFSVNNPATLPLMRRLSIETPWLDDVAVYFRHAGQTVASYALGDRLVFQQRPIDSRYFVLDHAFAPGLSEVFIRVETPDPLVLPMYLTSTERAAERSRLQDYSYGFLYGFLIALLAYNTMLYIGLRDSRYILYALYLGVFMLMNLSYTGHAFHWLWPGDTDWAQWSNPILIVAYGMSGLFFALRFLDTRRHFPTLHRAMLGYLGIGAAALCLTLILGGQRDALLVAFSFIFLFTWIMLGLGLLSVRSGYTPARYFLLAALAAMVGAALTTLAVWGFIPYETWIFRAAEVGMLLDATLLALALAQQVRAGQEEKLRAMQLATLDPLTGLSNRRAFYDKAAAIWNITQRHSRNLSVILFDLDKFKQINDTYGHAYGDEALVATADILRKSIRQQDVAARWGGEEFILLLPETDLEEAVALAERLRTGIAGIRICHLQGDITLTASFGVAQRMSQQPMLDTVISAADKSMYHSKLAGRDRVSYQPLPEAA